MPPAALALVATRAGTLPDQVVLFLLLPLGHDEEAVSGNEGGSTGRVVSGCRGRDIVPGRTHTKYRGRGEAGRRGGEGGR